MRQILEFIALLCLNILLHVAGNLAKAPNTEGIVGSYGYPIETHYVITEDGYNITVHRIPHGLANASVRKPRPAVLLMHGLMSSSADFVNAGPKHSLGYVLADAGYDVWMGNARGTLRCRKHLTLDPLRDAEKFWNYSWHEIGFYDVPAIIDFALDINGAESLYYIGHSEGTTDFLVLTTTRPEYNNKIKIASLMAPAVLMSNNGQGIIGMLLPYLKELQVLTRALGVFEIPFVDFMSEWASENCIKPEFQDLCVALIYEMGGEADDPEFNRDLLSIIASNAPNSGSLKQFFHYGQNIISGNFAQFDYGPEKNKDIYGSESPPLYDFSKITTPVAIYYGPNDKLVHTKDVEKLIPRIPNIAKVDLIPHSLFNHIDFLWAIHVVDLVYNDLMETMSKY